MFERLKIIRNSRLARRRESVIADDFPDLLRFLAGCLRAGLSVRQSLAESADRMEGPLAEELKTASLEQESGLSVEEALRGLAMRCDTRDAAAAAAVLSIASRYGGDAPAALDDMADVCAGRSAMRREVHALTAQARFSAVIMSILPLCFFLFFPAGGGIGAILADPLGVMAIGAGLALNGCGAYALARLSDPRRLC